MRIALTGAGGFLGSEILRQLACENNVDVVAFSSKETLPAESLFDKKLIVLSPDQATCSESYHGVDVLINCAFPRNANGAAIANGMNYLATVFNVSSQLGIAIVNVSSQSVYDQHRKSPAMEQTPLCLDDSYAVAKYATELLLKAHCSEMPHTSIRLASLIGPGFDQRVVNKMIKKAIAGETIVVTDNGSRYGYLDVRDAASGILAVAKNAPESWLPVYNLGIKQGLSLTDIGRSIERIANCEFCLKCNIAFKEKDSPCEAVCSTVDSSLLIGQFKWMQSISLDETVRSIFEYERRHRIGFKEDA